MTGYLGRSPDLYIKYCVSNYLLKTSWNKLKGQIMKNIIKWLETFLFLLTKTMSFLQFHQNFRLIFFLQVFARSFLQVFITFVTLFSSQSMTKYSPSINMDNLIWFEVLCWEISLVCLGRRNVKFTLLRSSEIYIQIQLNCCNRVNPYYNFILQ